eukprot:6531505-Pyramimonas_sp.AAC.1
MKNTFALGTWTQARLKDRGLADDDACQLCHTSKGTRFHRRFECEAFDGDRRQSVSAACSAAARRTKEWGQDLEKYAVGVLPHPRELIPPPLSLSGCQVFWFNKPASGRLSGRIFFDGSAINPQCEDIRRAGWSLVQTNEFGDVILAAYGPVPREGAPWQQARGGGDYAYR